MTALSIVSYNSQSLGAGRVEYISELVTKHDFTFLQEHWLLNAQIPSIESKIPNVSVHGVSGMPDAELLHGRPYGGCAILWKKSLSCKVSPVLNSSCKRYCAVKVELDDHVLLLVNVYMPCDSGTHSDAREYADVLESISGTCLDNNIMEIIIGGDFNTDFSRLLSLNTRNLSAFMTRESLQCSPEMVSKGFTHTFESKIDGSRSVLDHFLITGNLSDSIVKYYVVHEGHNLSDHSALVMALNISVEHCSQTQNDNDSVQRPQWHLATPENLAAYKNRLNQLVGEIIIPNDCVQCEDFFCERHGDDLNAFYTDMNTFLKPEASLKKHPSLTGMNMYRTVKNVHCFGIVFGSVAILLDMGFWQTLDALPEPSIMLLCSTLSVKMKFVKPTN